MLKKIKNKFNQPPKLHWLNCYKSIGLFLEIYIFYGIIMSIYVANIATKAATLLSIMSLICFALIDIYIAFYVKSLNIDYSRPKHYKKKYVINIIKNLCIIFFSSLILRSLIIGIGSSSKLYHPGQIAKSNQGEIESIMRYSLSSKIWMLVASIVLLPIIEEFLYRFIIIGPKNVNGRKISPHHRFICMIASIIIFAFIHIEDQLFSMTWDYTDIIQLLAAVSEYLVLSAVLCYNYYRHGNFWNNTILHMCWNLITIII